MGIQAASSTTSRCKVARPLLRDLDALTPDLIVSDCPLAALQLEQQRGQRVYHPVEALDAAYDGRTLRARTEP